MSEQREKLLAILSEIAAGMAPGAGIADAGGKFPAVSDPNRQFHPGLVENLREGNLGTAGMQALGAGGDAAMAIPIAGAAIGSAMKLPRATQRALQGLGVGFEEFVDKLATKTPGIAASAKKFPEDIPSIIEDMPHTMNSLFPPVGPHEANATASLSKIAAIPESAAIPSQGKKQYSTQETLDYFDAIGETHQPKPTIAEAKAQQPTPDSQALDNMQVSIENLDDQKAFSELLNISKKKPNTFEDALDIQHDLEDLLDTINENAALSEEFFEHFWPYAHSKVAEVSAIAKQKAPSDLSLENPLPAQAKLRQNTLVRSINPSAAQQELATEFKARVLPPENLGTLKVDGVEHPTTNILNLPIHPTKRGQENFWRWFGESKARDAFDRPMVLYHGTGFDNEGVFQTTSGMYFFSSDPKFASNWASNKLNGSHVVPAYLKMEKPFDFRDPRMVDQVEEEYKRLFDTKFFERRRIKEGHWTSIEDPQVLHAIKNLGFDAILVKESSTSGINFAVFDNKSIKSAIGNTGDYGKADPRIHHSLPLAIGIGGLAAERSQREGN